LVWNHHPPEFWAEPGVLEYREPPPGNRPAPLAELVRVLWMMLPGVVVEAPVLAIDVATL
jgi:hypothetical protein